MASATCGLFLLVALEILSTCSGVWTQSADGRQELVLYPRVGKRSISQDPHVMRRRDFLNFLANSWQRTGSLRGAIHEIQDMTESKRADIEPLIFPGPRVGRSNKEAIDDQYRAQGEDKKWAKPRIGKKSSPVATIVDDEGNAAEIFQAKRVPFARLG